MLGWMVLVWRAGDGAAMDQERVLARWETGVGGLRWLGAAFEADLAKALGYPLRFQVRADAFSRTISGGLPANDSPEVIGDDYVLPAGYNAHCAWMPSGWADALRTDGWSSRHGT